MKCYKMRSFKDKKPSPLNSEKVKLTNSLFCAYQCLYRILYTLCQYSILYRIVGVSGRISIIQPSEHWLTKWCWGVGHDNNRRVKNSPTLLLGFKDFPTGSISREGEYICLRFFCLSSYLSLLLSYFAGKRHKDCFLSITKAIETSH